MASISNDYTNNRRSIDELEQDFETQKKRLKERTETREARMEANYKNGLKEAEERTEKTTQQVRDEFIKSNASARENDRAARSELAKSHYDRLGRIQEQADLQNKTNATQVDALEKTAKNDAARMKDLEGHYEDRLKKASEENQRQLESSARRLNASNGRVQRAAGTYTEAEYQSARKEAEEAINRAREEIQHSRSETNRAVQDSESRSKTMQAKYEDDADQRTARTQQTYEEKLRNNAEYERRSREGETVQLRKQVKDFAAEQKIFGKDLNEARARTIRETEGDYAFQMKNQELTHNSELTHQKNLERALERNLNRNFDQALREKDMGQAVTVKRITAENQNQLAQTRDEFDRAFTDQKLSHDHEKETMNRTFSAQRQAQVENGHRALEKQAEAYRNAMQNSNESSFVQNNSLEKENRELKTTQDPSRVSPGVENKIRERVGADYEKQLQAEKNRNAAQGEQTRSEFQDRFVETLNDKNRTVAATHRQALVNQAELSRQFTNQVDELEYSKKEALRQATEQNIKSQEHSRKVSEKALVAQSRQSSESAANRDLDIELRMKRLQEDHEFENRQTKRDYAVKMNIAQRDFERKLTVQAEDYENQISDLKKTLSTYQRDSDKRTSQLLADQSRNYDKRIAEIESQAKQREKIQERSYEEELDKVKRANALLLSKKS